MPFRAPRLRAVSACLALCIGTAACDGPNDAAFGPRGTALPPPGLDAAPPAAAEPGLRTAPAGPREPGAAGPAAPRRDLPTRAP
ncbi:hypothetical protein GCM10010964_00360 [Caldovatus sediminis]|uniref:Uncharacterized protein n=1 Tax=Caldovatus sediminis TaxID=2041189 RepID=A0A8J3E9Q8_9PROT|nr:hypothetical protein GCM10010964_00360 [Caldovatus sediminis]